MKSDLKKKGDGGESSEDKVKRKMKKKLTISKMKREAYEELPSFAIGGIALVASSMSNASLPTLLGTILDTTSGATSAAAETATCVADAASNMNCSANANNSSKASHWTPLLIIVLGGGLASFIRTTIFKRVENRIASRLRVKLFRSLLSPKRPVSFFAKNSPASLGIILTEDVNTVSKSITMSFASFLRSFSSVTYSTIMMVRISPQLLGVSVSAVPLIGGAAMLFHMYIKKITSRQRDLVQQTAEFAQERFKLVNIVKLANAELRETERYEEMQQDAIILGRKSSIADGLFMGGIFASTAAALLGVFYMGGKLVSAGSMTSGSLTSFATYSFLLGAGTSGLFKATGEISSGIVCAERVFDITDDERYITSEKGAELQNMKDSNDSLIADGDGVLKVSGISFSYDSVGNVGKEKSLVTGSKNVIENISFELTPGKVLAVVGKNGAGKSTLVQLLVGLYQPSVGTITIGDTPLSQIPPSKLKHLVGVVPQDNSTLFDESFEYNVKYFNPEATPSQVDSVMKLSNCEKLIEGLDEGTKTKLGRDGSRLSGGQRQRVSLSRALLSDPRVLILDEPTSQLDTEGESAVEDAVRACRSGADGDGKQKSLLLITHRRSTLSMVDDVIVLDEGKIVEHGSFSKLSADENSALCQLMPDLM